MDVTPLIRKGQQIIQAYVGGTFKISGQRYDYPVFVMPERTWRWNITATTIEDLKIHDFEDLKAQSDSIDVVLFGCGLHMAFLPNDLKVELKRAGLSVDIMDTGAACRTYNVLMAEGRRVACALLPAA